jgi:3-methyladenine DNA glycosylase/8-oxoguanine DNA glycosylase
MGAMSLARAELRRALSHLRRADPVLAAIVREVGPCRFAPDRRARPFAALVEALVYQQITGKAAATIYRRLCDTLGRRQPRPEDVARATDEALRSAGLSRQKILYLRDLAAHAQDGLPLARLSRLDDESVVAALSRVKGIGRWTAEMYLMFRLGRLDVLPVGDYGIQKAMQRAYRLRGLPKPDRMRRLAEPWRPYRTIACWYLWRSLNIPVTLASSGREGQAGP